jgi:hypothetical protein
MDEIELINDGIAGLTEKFIENCHCLTTNDLFKFVFKSLIYKCRTKLHFVGPNCILSDQIAFSRTKNAFCRTKNAFCRIKNFTNIYFLLVFIVIVTTTGRRNAREHLVGATDRHNSYKKQIFFSHAKCTFSPTIRIFSPTKCNLVRQKAFLSHTFCIFSPTKCNLI